MTAPRYGLLLACPHCAMPDGRQVLLQTLRDARMARSALVEGELRLSRQWLDDVVEALDAYADPDGLGFVPGENEAS